MRSPATTALAAVALAAVCAAPALASRAPTAAERRAIVRAVKASPETALVRGRFDVRAIHVSTVPTAPYRYARVRIAPKPGAQADGATGIVRRLNGRWRLADIGTSHVGCGLPARVRADLQLNRDQGCAP